MHPLKYKVVFQDFCSVLHFVNISAWGQEDAENSVYRKFDECAIVLSVRSVA